jgi:hypothetical protein
MSEGFNRAQETIQDKNYNELQVAEHEIEVIFKEIDKVFSTSPSKIEAEKVIVAIWAPKLDAAMKKSTQALEKWIASLQS